MKNILILFSIFITFISCEKVIPFDENETKSKLVINGIFQSDSIFKIHVSNSKSIISDSAIQNIDNATVLIEDIDGNTIDELIYSSNGFYIGQTYPNENQNYRLRVNCPGYNEITSNDGLPGLISINNIDTNTIISNSDEGDYLELTVSFNDPVESQNFYLVETYAIGPWGFLDDGDTIWDEYDTIQVEMNLTDEAFINDENLKEGQGLFNDLLFNGETKLLKVEIPKGLDFYDEDYKEYFFKTETLIFYIHNISKSYYYFRTSLELYNQRSGNPFAQPVQVYSNINNGFGIFAGAQVSSYNL